MVGVNLSLTPVNGIQNGDVVSYNHVSGSCGIVNGATVAFSDAGTCVVRARVERRGYRPWTSLYKSIIVERGRLTTVQWTPAIGGTVGIDLVLDPVDGIQNGDVVTYIRVSGTCQFASGSEVAERTLSFSAEETCMVRAKLIRRGYHPWTSLDKSISVGVGKLSNLDWSPAAEGVVGIPLVLDAVSGARNGDVSTYTKVSGACSFGTGSETARRTLIFVDAGICVVRARVERGGYHPWDSREKSIAVELGTLSNVGWNPETRGTVGVNFVLSEINGIQDGDVVDYVKVSGNCDLDSKRNMTFSDEGTCVVMATLERRGHQRWSSGKRSISVALGTLFNIGWNPARSGTAGEHLLVVPVRGTTNGDTVTYHRVSGDCQFGGGSEKGRRMLALISEGTCVVEARVKRKGYNPWNSGPKAIEAVLPLLKGIGWNPVAVGTVGTNIILERVLGTRFSDTITYTKVHGDCSFGSGDAVAERTLSLNGEGVCTVKANVERRGYASWDSKDRYISMLPPPPQGISWSAQSTTATEGDTVVFDTVDGVQNGDTVSYVKVLGNCEFGHGSSLLERTLSLSAQGICVVKAKVTRSGYAPWESAEVSVTVSAPMIGLPCGGTTHGGERFYSTDTAFSMVRENGSVITWGNPLYGGDSSDVPTGALDSGVVKIFSTKGAFAALKSDGTVVTWGHAHYGGNSSAVSGGALNTGVKVCEIFASEQAFSALKEDGSIVAWGSSLHGGKLAVMKFYYRIPDWEGIPLHPSFYGRGVTKIVAGGGAFAALKEDGSVFTWGNELRGGDRAVITGGGSLVYDIRPNFSNKKMVDIYSNGHAFVAIGEETVDGQKVHSAVSWGHASYGGNAPQGKLAIGVDRVFSNEHAFAALMKDGSVVAWGDAGRGGWFGSNIASKLQSGVVEIFSNKFTFVALKDDGSLVSWGNLYSGGSTQTVSFPESSLQSGVKKVLSTGYAFAALKTDGSVVVWGDRRAGGDSSRVGNTLDGGVVDLLATEYTFAALRSNGSVVGWGSYYGSIPKSFDINCLSDGVFRLGGSTKKAYVALRDDGTLATWGDPLSGGHLYYGGNGDEMEKCEL